MAELESACYRMANLWHACSNSVSATNVKGNTTIRQLEEQKKEATAQENNLSKEVFHLRAKLGSVRVELESI